MVISYNFVHTGVILDNVVLRLDPDSQGVVEKQSVGNILDARVDLQFSEDSANFVDGIDFWNVTLYFANDDAGQGELE